MASMTIRDIDERLKARLRVQAAHHGRFMEDEARDILRTALSAERSRMSEALRPVPEPSVLNWLVDRPSASLFTTAVTRGEILYGIRLSCDGRRRKGLWDAANQIFNEDFALSK